MVRKTRFFNSITYNSALKSRPSLCFFGSVKGIITKICQIYIDFILFMINQVIKIRFKISSKLTLLFLICISITYSQKCIKELIFLLLLCSGDIESNRGPKKTASISFCHWNLNNITAHNFSKVTLLKAMSASS